MACDAQQASVSATARLLELAQARVAAAAKGEAAVASERRAEDAARLLALAEAEVAAEEASIVDEADTRGERHPHPTPPTLTSTLH